METEVTRRFGERLKDEPSGPNKDYKIDFETRLTGNAHIARYIQVAAGEDPNAALYLIETLRPEEQRPELYGIVATHLAYKMSELEGKDPERFAEFKQTPAYEMLQRLLDYTTSRTPYLVAQPDPEPPSS